MRPHKTAFAVMLFMALAGWAVSAGRSQTKAQPANEAGHAQGLSDAGKSALSSQLNEAVRRGDTPGVVALVVSRDSVLYEGAAGKLDVAHHIAMPVNAIFAIASLTKPVPSVAILMLVEEGKLKLDDPVSKYLSGFDNLQVITNFNERDATYETRPAKRPMTIRHLLTHTSGIGYAFSSPIEYRLTEATKKNQWELPLLTDPGSEWHYSASTRVLGMIVEKITGDPLETYYQERIFKPLGRADTSFPVPPAKQSRAPPQHTRTHGRVGEQPRATIPSTPTPPFRGDGGLYSTVQDYGRFMRMILNGRRFGAAKNLSEG